MRFLKFTLVGVMNTAVDFAVFNLLALGLGLHVAVASAISYSAGILNSYVWNRRWTFADRSGGDQRSEFIRFILANLLGAFVNTALAWGVVAAFGWAESAGGPVLARALMLNLAKAVAIGGSMLVNYLAFHHWVFPGTSPAEETRTP